MKSYFKNNAFNWHFVQLLEMEQKFLIFNDDEDSLANWTGTLLYQFKKNMSLTQKTIFKKHYTFENTTYKCELREYINQIIHNFKSANFLIYNQFIAIRDNVAVEF